MGTRNQLWSIAKMSVTGGVIGITISDRYVTVVAIKGHSMHPTMTGTDSALRGDIVLAEKGCLDRYKFSRGDVILFKCPSNHKEVFVKRLIGLPGEWIQLPASSEIIKVPQGHCWVEGDNAARSWDSRSFGPIPLGLINGRVTHIIWPPSKMGRVERKWPEDRIPPF
ncbi:mitochondrial inner membrane protease subunit 2-like [Triticum urartu]|uniref:Mitochondrial inner membrane protease subunit 2 n=2 Tax=Triticum urartu TaxID=4572 RepID=A0A8R7RAW3_TRIUA|nr:mitochondrial inner membrane protease subunit 2-like [Triticum urartu]